MHPASGGSDPPHRELRTGRPAAAGALLRSGQPTAAAGSPTACGPALAHPGAGDRIWADDSYRLFRAGLSRRRRNHAAAACSNHVAAAAAVPRRRSRRCPGRDHLAAAFLAAEPEGAVVRAVLAAASSCWGLSIPPIDFGAVGRAPGLAPGRAVALFERESPATATCWVRPS
jgi:hypothetical protein